MPRFFVEHASSEQIIITGEDAHHIGRSLRMRTGEQLTVCAEGLDYECEITRITDSEVYLKPLSIAPCAAEPSVKVTLYQAVPKQDKLAEIVQKAVELGVYEIVPVLTSRCVSRPTKADFEKKRQRLQKIAVSAAKQSGRGIIPQVSWAGDFTNVLDIAVKKELALFMYETGEREALDTVLGANANVSTAAIITGPEGGFARFEADLAKACGLHICSMGERILRCETAPVVALTAMMYATGNLS